MANQIIRCPSLSKQHAETFVLIWGQSWFDSPQKLLLREHRHLFAGDAESPQVKIRTAPQIKLAWEWPSTILLQSGEIYCPMFTKYFSDIRWRAKPNWNSGPLGQFGSQSLTSIKDVACFHSFCSEHCSAYWWFCVCWQSFTPLPRVCSYNEKYR